MEMVRGKFFVRECGNYKRRFFSYLHFRYTFVRNQLSKTVFLLLLLSKCLLLNFVSMLFIVSIYIAIYVAIYYSYLL
jgi:hypothetical protein